MTFAQKLSGLIPMLQGLGGGQPPGSITANRLSGLPSLGEAANSLPGPQFGSLGGTPSPQPAVKSPLFGGAAMGPGMAGMGMQMLQNRKAFSLNPGDPRLNPYYGVMDAGIKGAQFGQQTEAFGMKKEEFDIALKKQKRLEKMMRDRVLNRIATPPIEPPAGAGDSGLGPSIKRAQAELDRVYATEDQDAITKAQFQLDKLLKEQDEWNRPSAKRKREELDIASRMRQTEFGMKKEEFDIALKKRKRWEQIIKDRVLNQTTTPPIEPPAGAGDSGLWPSIKRAQADLDRAYALEDPDAITKAQGELDGLLKEQDEWNRPGAKRKREADRLQGESDIRRHKIYNNYLMYGGLTGKELLKAQLDPDKAIEMMFEDPNWTRGLPPGYVWTDPRDPNKGAIVAPGMEEYVALYGKTGFQKDWTAYEEVAERLADPNLAPEDRALLQVKGNALKGRLESQLTTWGKQKWNLEVTAGKQFLRDNYGWEDGDKLPKNIGAFDQAAQEAAKKAMLPILAVTDIGLNAENPPPAGEMTPQEMLELLNQFLPEGTELSEDFLRALMGTQLPGAN